MSGTSLDGISAAVVRFTELDDAPPEGATGASAGTRYHSELLGFHVHEYGSAERERLGQAMHEDLARDYCRLAADLGGWLADAANAVIAEAGVPRSEIRAIGSHGQTLWHEPGHSTWQLDDPSVIAERCGIPVVSDFRRRDVAAGGQGAPLVPIADVLLFGGTGWRALQNIGGIGNVTIVPPNVRVIPHERARGDASELASVGTMAQSLPRMHEVHGGVRAFDTGPGVRVIDAVVHRLDESKRYDHDGAMAAAGTVVQPAVDALLRDPYFAMEPPKSTGRELFDATYVERVFALVREHAPGASANDLVATASALTAQSIADAYRRFMPEPVEEVLISGGGAKNLTLRRMLAEAVAPMTVRAFDDVYFDGEAKEAVAFALLAHLHLTGQTGNVVGATGARGARILGSYTPA